jgi:hypothetical protein
MRSGDSSVLHRGLRHRFGAGGGILPLLALSVLLLLLPGPADAFTLGRTPALLLTGDQGYDSFGSAASTAGDVNGDGFDDVIVGAPDTSNSLAGQGAAFVYFGSAAGLAAAPGWSVEGNEAGAHLGTAVASPGDPGGSGFSAVAVGLPGWAGGLAGQGRVLVYSGSSAGPASTPSTRIVGGLAGAGLGARPIALLPGRAE